MSTELTPAVIGAGAVIIAALISFIVAVTSAVIAKEQKVSEFRQAWIDSLRKEVSELIGLSYQMTVESEKVNALKQSTNPLTETIGKSALFKIELHIKMTALITQIKLRLNTKEHNNLISKLSYLSGLHMAKEHDSEKAFNTLDQIQSLFHDVLKSEWERVKNGELRYRLFITSGKILIGASLAVFFALLIRTNFPHLFLSIGF